MHQDPEHEDYDDDEYQYYPEYNEHGYPQQFKFDWNSWELWLKDAIQDIIDAENTWVVGYSKKQPEPPEKSQEDIEIENLLKEKFIFFGENKYKEPIWKTKYFIANYFDIFYKNHFMSNARHIIQQPNYYKSLYDIMN